MNYAQRRAATHARARTKFGTDADGAQMYVFHNGATIACYQSSGVRGRGILSQLLVKEDTLTVHAAKTDFTAVPLPGDAIKIGLTLATSRTLRIDSVNPGSTVSPSYELDLMDPNLATTATP